MYVFPGSETPTLIESLFDKIKKKKKRNWFSFWGGQIYWSADLFASQHGLMKCAMCWKLKRNRTQKHSLKCNETGYSTLDNYLHTHRPCYMAPKRSVQLAVVVLVPSKMNRCAGWLAFVTIPRKFCIDTVSYVFLLRMLLNTATSACL